MKAQTSPAAVLVISAGTRKAQLSSAFVPGDGEVYDIKLFGDEALEGLGFGV